MNLANEAVDSTTTYHGTSLCNPPLNLSVNHHITSRHTLPFSQQAHFTLLVKKSSREHERSRIRYHEW
jgi:hypothetical protein